MQIGKHSYKLLLLVAITLNYGYHLPESDVADNSSVTINASVIPFGSSQIHIESDSLIIEFDVFPYVPKNKQWHSAQVAATLDTSNLIYFTEGEIGRLNPFFSPGTGIASEPDQPYDHMYIGESGHHYVYYESDSNTRGIVLNRHENGMLRLKWPIESFSIDKKTTSIRESGVNKLYLMIFIDYNLNKVIEPDEYSLVTVNFVRG